MRALITGGTGFVGGWLVAHLESCGDEVRATGEEADVTDITAIGAAIEEFAPDAIFHLAGQAHVGTSWSDPADTYRVNVIGTVNVCDAARRLDPKPRVLVISSAEVYGRVSPDELPITEENPTRPTSPYAASKISAEVVAQQAVLGFDVPALVARPFNHIGPGQSPTFVVSALAKRIVDAERSGGTRLEMGNPTPRRDLADVRDVVRAYRLLVEKGEPGQSYNVATGHDVVIGELAKRLIELSGVELELVTGAVEMRPADIPVLRGDPGKLQRATGWSPEIPLDQTLADVLAYWRSRPA